MKMQKKQTAQIDVQGTLVRVIKINGADYICITDIAALKNSVEPKDVVKNWMRSRATISFLGLWEKLHNPEFKGVDFDPLLRVAGDNAFTMPFNSGFSCAHCCAVGLKLICLSNMENINAVMINDGIPQPQRLKRLNEIAIHQMKVLTDVGGRNLLQ